MHALADSSQITVALPNGRGYPVHFAPLAKTPTFMQQCGLRVGRCLVVTDEKVAVHYAGILESALARSGWQVKTVAVAPGEPSKDISSLQRVYDSALRWGIDRQTPVVALGGGVVGDLAGFAAATLLRGLPLVQVPTTLVAQVDSAIGGKTGINHPVGKNLIGAFHQPSMTCADVATLSTLAKVDWASGLAEVVKHALIADDTFRRVLVELWPAISGRDAAAIRTIVPWAASIKARIVAEDERESGQRAVLNFGHTFGHAIERVAGYGQFTHGEAVALGMRAGLKLSHLLNSGFPLERALQLVRRIPVRTSLSAFCVTELMEAMRFDKKVQAGRQRLVVLRQIGEAYITNEATPADVRTAWEFACH